MSELTRQDAASRCAQCSFEAAWPFQLDHHIRRANHTNANAIILLLFSATIQPEVYSCIRCSFINHHKLRLYEHYKKEHDNAATTVNGESYYWCHHCGYTGQSSLCLLQHHHVSCSKIRKAAKNVGSVESNESHDLDSEASTSKRLRCAQCSYKCNDASNFERHKLVHAKAVPWFYCVKCSYRAKLEQKMKEHVRTHTAPKEKLFYCDKCSYRAKRKGNLERHLLTHTKKECGDWYVCTWCTYRTKYATYLKRHEPIHTPLERACSQCSYRTKDGRSLRNHVMTHATSQSFACDKCPYRGKLKSYLAHHIRWAHSAEAMSRFKNCDNCGYRTKSEYLWKMHIAKHERVEEVICYKCDKCAYKTTEKRSFSRHRLKHGGVKDDKVWFKCDQCYYSVREKATLERHRLRHIGAAVTWFNCDYCPFVTNEEANLRKHVKEHVLQAIKSTNASTEASTNK